jgi:hypothetical protein
VHTADVKNVLRVFSIEVPAREKDDLKEDPIVIRLRKVCSYSSQMDLLRKYFPLSLQAGGASYDGV